MDILSIIACVFSILGKISVNHKWKVNFLFFVLGYAAWITWSLTTTPNVPMIFMYLVYTALSIDGYIKWRKDDASKKGKGRLSLWEDGENIQVQSEGRKTRTGD